MTTDKISKLLVTLCTYNERENLERLIPEIHRTVPDAHVLVIDDNSPDGTGELADAIASTDERIHVIHREGKLGLGTATITGFRYGIEHGYEYLLNMDADFSHPLRYIPGLLNTVQCGPLAPRAESDSRSESATLQRADVSIGSRYVPGGGIEGWGLRRHLMSRGINLYARLLLGLKTRDTSGSFRCYRVAKLAELDLDRLRARGYAFQEEILYRLRRLGCRFEEVPIVFEERRYGRSKIGWREAVSAAWVIFRLGLERMMRR